jgi:hypothetical protein
MKPTSSAVQSIHTLYCHLTGFDLRLDMYRESVWFEFLKQFNEADLKLVVRDIQRKKHNHEPARSLKFRNLIGSLDQDLQRVHAFFEDDLKEIKARNRGRTDPNRAAVLRATGREASESQCVRTPAQILAGVKAAEDFRRLGQSL